LTFIAGVYGMNFGLHAGAALKVWYFGGLDCVMIIVAAVMLYLFWIVVDWRAAPGKES
jgi:Mg2+ and Co2+ transporter CorA